MLHLHLHSEYSQLDGLGKPEQYIRRAKRLGMKAIAITDHANIDGALKWQKACLKEGIKPIIGCELYIVPDMKVKEKGEKRGHITLLVKNQAGWQALLKMLTIANVEGFYYRPRIDYKVLWDEMNDGLIMLSGCSSSFLNLPGGVRLFLDLIEDGCQGFLEVMPHKIDSQLKINKLALDISKEYNVSLVSTNDCFVEGTKIITSAGIKSIQDIQVGDLVFTHKGNYKRVLSTNKRPVIQGEQIYKLKASVGTEAGRVSRNHPYYICKYSYYKKKPYDFCWKEAAELSKDDYLLMPKVKKEDVFAIDDLLQIDLLEIKNYQLVNRNTYFKNGIEYIRTVQSDRFGIDIPRFIQIDDDFLNILGWALAQGGIDNQCHVSLSFHKLKKWKAEKCEHYFKLFGLKVSFEEAGNYIKISFGSSALSELFSYLIGKGAINKHLPYIGGTFIKKWSEEQLSKIMSAYSSEDGSYSCEDGRFMVCSTVSRQLVYEFNLVLNCIGIPASIEVRYNHAHENWNWLHNINLSGIRLHKFLQWRNEPSDYDKKRHSKFIELEDFYAVKFQDKEEIDYDGYLYNLEVEGDNSYVADGFVVHNCHYVLKDQSEAQEVLLAIQRKAKWADPDRWKFGFDGLHLRSQKEMEEAFEAQGQLSKRQYLSAMMNTYKIAEQCWDFRIENQKPSLPVTKYEKQFPKVDADYILRKFCSDHVIAGDMANGRAEGYEERFEAELELISKKGFARYFLIVYEIIQFCKESQIAVGPGRGSVGGSLVAFMLGITQVDPIKYDLLFERFISEQRVDLPDIDVDFDRNKIDQVRSHLQELYGEYNVAGISTFMSMKSRAAIRDVCRVFDISLKEVDAFSKSIPREGENGIEIASKSQEGQNFVKKYSREFNLACQLEGQVRGSGQHPAGIIISGEDLRNSNRCNLSMREGVAVVNWDMADSEYMGLIKIDVLKLGTLSVLEECKRLINESQKEDLFSFEKICLVNKEVFEMLSKGHTAGVFQLSGYACRKLCKEMKINNFNDIIAIVALSRPGPLASGMTEKYIKRKHGLKWRPLHPLYENITSDTFGVMVYQEQMMRAMIDLAGMSGSDADRIRKVIGKKRDPKEFEPYRLKFLQGCKDKKTLLEIQAESFWQGLLEWAHYGFVKAHSTEYALIAYWTAFVKVFYFPEFLCATLTYGEEKDKEELIQEAQNKGIQIVTPKVGISDARKWQLHEGKAYMPFIEVKGVGESQAEKCAKMAGGKRLKQKGFFGLLLGEEFAGVKEKGLTALLQEIKAFDQDPEARPLRLKEYFQFSFK